jgi:hypothetical protein
MNVTAMGKVAVTTAGTPQALSATPLMICHLQTQAAPANTGKVYIGTPGMVKSTLAGVIHVFQPPTPGDPLEIWELEPHEDTDPLYLQQYAIDADVSGEGLLVAYWIQ